MSGFYAVRKLRYEIQALIDKRWQIAEIVTDGREQQGRDFDRLDFEALERAVLAKAAALAAGGTVTAVRVMRERVRREDGFTTIAQIFFRGAPAKAEGIATLGRFDGEVAPCSEPGDLYARPACRVIGALLRSWLDQQAITALELLHLQPYQRKLNDSFSLLQGAIHQVAARQAQTGGDTAKSRSEALSRLVGAVESKAREALAEKRLPQIEDGGGFAKFEERMAARYEGERLRFFTMVALARRFQGSRSVAVRLDFALEALAAAQSEPIRRLLDELAAGALDSTSLVMDLLGPQPNLAGALERLAALARGEGSFAEGESGEALRQAIAAGRLPAAADSLWDRLLREVRRGRQLARHGEPRQEWALLMRMSDRLRQMVPPERRPELEAACRDRLRRLRESVAASG